MGVMAPSAWVQTTQHGFVAQNGAFRNDPYPKDVSTAGTGER